MVKTGTYNYYSGREDDIIPKQRLYMVREEVFTLADTKSGTSEFFQKLNDDLRLRKIDIGYVIHFQ